MEFTDFLKLVIVPFLIALTAVWIVHPHIVKIALLKKIVDNPNARKLQKEPVPVLGGIAVFFGIFLSLAFAHTLAPCSGLFALLAATMIMLYLGSIDDILELKASSRLIVQIGAVLAMIFMAGGQNYQIDTLVGLLGIWQIPWWFSVPLTVFVIVGIINATNLIDGVDGLSSGFGVMASLFFLAAFLYVGDPTMVILCAATIGALTLFFLHNVFGKKSKMFIGDSGTLVLGIILSAYVGRLIHSAATLAPADFPNVPASVIPFTLAVLSVPVFDTLRVMSIRISKGKSPFHPDKTHLHHLFIDMGFSHVITTVCVLSLDVLVIAIWAVLCFAGAAAWLQTAAVILAGLGVTFGLNSGVKRFKQCRPERYRQLAEYIRSRQPRRDGWFLTMQQLIDKI